MPSMFSSFDGQPSSNRSRNASRHREDRSHGEPDPSNFGSFMTDFARNFQECRDTASGGHAGYRIEEVRPRDRSHSPSRPQRGRAGSHYTTEEVRPRDHSRSSSASPPSRRPRSPSPTSYSNHFRDAGRGNAQHAPSPGYKTRGRSPSHTPPKTYGKYSQAPRRSPSPPYETHTTYPSPPRSSEKYGRARPRSPSPVRRARTQREASPVRPPSPIRRARTQCPGTSDNSYGAHSRTPHEPSPVRPRPGTSDNSYGARDNDRYRAPSPRAYKTRSVSPPGASSQQRPSTAQDDGSRSESRTQPAEEPTPPKESSKDKKHWYSKFTNGKKTWSKTSSSKQPEPRRAETEPQEQPRANPRGRPDTAGFKNFKCEQQSSSARPQESERGRSDPKTKYSKMKEDCYKTEERKPSSSEGGTPPKTEDSFPGAGTAPPFNAYSPPKPTAPYKPAPVLSTLKALFDAYNARWEFMSRTDPKLPMPATWADLKAIDFNGGLPDNINNHTDETIVVANLQIIFLAGFGMLGVVTRYAEGLIVNYQGQAIGGKEAEFEALGKWLSRKEQPRWHPDRINLRTGKNGVIDEGISKKTCVVAMRSAVQALLAVIAKND